jgi:hypothetical protein
MFTNPGVVLILFVLPDAKNFGNLRTCDNINSGRLSKPVLTDSISQTLEGLSYLDNLSGLGNIEVSY